MKARGLLAALVFLGAVAPGAAAAPFAVVVPDTIRVDTTAPAFRVSFLYWGWLAATGETLTEQDLMDAQITIDIDDSRVVIDQSAFLNLGVFAPLDSGEVAGMRLDPGNTAYDTLLAAGESLKNPTVGLLETVIDFPEGHTDTATVTGSIVLAGEELSYSTTVLFGEFGLSGPRVVLGQRVLSVPIPVPVRPATWGSLKQRYGSAPGGS